MSSEDHANLSSVFTIPFAVVDESFKRKLSVFKCVTCEEQARKSAERGAPVALVYFLDKSGRGRVCPNCGQSNVVKVSVGAVMKRRWDKSVKARLNALSVES